MVARDYARGNGEALQAWAERLQGLLRARDAEVAKLKSQLGGIASLVGGGAPTKGPVSNPGPKKRKIEEVKTEEDLGAELDRELEYLEAAEEMEAGAEMEGGEEGDDFQEGEGYDMGFDDEVQEDQMQMEDMSNEDKEMFEGVIVRFDMAGGRGFIESAAAKEAYKNDVYVHASVLAKAGAAVGDVVRFAIHVNKAGLPQASAPMQIVEKTGDTKLPYRGVVKSFNDKNGYGFVECVELHEVHGRDVYLPGPKAINTYVGQHVVFDINLNNDGMPVVSEIYPMVIEDFGKGGGKGKKGGKKGGGKDHGKDHGKGYGKDFGKKGDARKGYEARQDNRAGGPRPTSAGLGPRPNPNATGPRPNPMAGQRGGAAPSPRGGGGGALGPGGLGGYGPAPKGGKGASKGGKGGKGGYSVLH